MFKVPRINATDENAQKYRAMSVGTSFPGSPIDNQLFFNTSNNKLFKRVGSVWVEIDWISPIKGTPEWQANRLRIHTGNQLQISPDGTNWNNCIPAIGADNIEILSYDNTAFSNLFYLPPGGSVSLRGANHIPVVFGRQEVSFDIRVDLQVASSLGALVLRINNINTTAYYAETYRTDSVGGSGAYTFVGHRIGWIGFSPNFRSYVNFSIQVSPNGRTQSSGNYKYYDTTYGVIVFSNYSDIASTHYWLGTLVDSATTTPRPANLISVTRTV